MGCMTAVGFQGLLNCMTSNVMIDTHTSAKEKVRIYLIHVKRMKSNQIQSRISLLRHFLPNPARILPVLAFNGRNPLNVNVAGISICLWMWVRDSSRQ